MLACGELALAGPKPRSGKLPPDCERVVANLPLPDYGRVARDPGATRQLRIHYDSQADLADKPEGFRPTFVLPVIRSESRRCRSVAGRTSVERPRTGSPFVHHPRTTSGPQDTNGESLSS